MLNEQMFRKIFEAPSFSIAKPMVNHTVKNKPTPSKVTIDKVVGAIKGNKGICRQELLAETKLSTNCLDGSLAYLVEKRVIHRKSIGRAGPKYIYTYEMAQ